jgi:hypothetical protein
VPRPREAASEELQALGFSRRADGEWIPDAHGDVVLRVRLPQDFPFALPIVSIDRDSLKEAIPHVERNGKVCIAANAGILLDPGRPRALVREAIDRARGIVSAGVAGTNRAALLEEFSAYWGAFLLFAVAPGTSHSGRDDTGRATSYRHDRG